jgi:hypothetical protein
MIHIDNRWRSIMMTSRNERIESSRGNENSSCNVFIIVLFHGPMYASAFDLIQIVVYCAG